MDIKTSHIHCTANCSLFIHVFISNVLSIVSRRNSPTSHLGACCCLSPQALREVQLPPQLPGLLQFSAAHHLLPAQLPDQRRHPRSDLPHRAVTSLLGRSRLHRHPPGQRRRLLRHQEAKQLHGGRLPAEAGAPAQGLPH